MIHSKDGISCILIGDCLFSDVETVYVFMYFCGFCDSYIQFLIEHSSHVHHQLSEGTQKTNKHVEQYNYRTKKHQVEHSLFIFLHLLFH